MLAVFIKNNAIKSAYSCLTTNKQCIYCVIRNSGKVAKYINKLCFGLLLMGLIAQVD
jgi:hypothetical protein